MADDDEAVPKVLTGSGFASSQEAPQVSSALIEHLMERFPVQLVPRDEPHTMIYEMASQTGKWQIINYLAFLNASQQGERN